MLKLLLIILISVFIFFININETFDNTQNEYTYGIVMCCFNRPEYLSRTLESLSKSNIKNTHICIINDSSDNKETNKLIRNFTLDKPNVKITKIRNKNNLGITKSLLKGYSNIHPSCKYLLNIDSDVIMNKDWLHKLKTTHTKFKTDNPGNECIVTGFNCIDSCGHKIQEIKDDYNIKSSIGGINMFFDKSTYLIIKPVLENTKGNGWDWDVVKLANDNNVKLITTKPSCIQHIGLQGMFSNGIRADNAEDFIEDFNNMDNYNNIKINIINLVQSKDRFDCITKQCDKYNIKYNRIVGIDGSKYKLTKYDKEKLQNVDYNPEKLKGITGCHLSHIKSLRLHKDSDYVIICEDDIQIIEPEFNKIINKILNKINIYDNHLIYLSGRIGNTANKQPVKYKIDDKYTLYKGNKWLSQGNMMYLITNKGINDLLNKYENNKCHIPVDHFFIHKSENVSIIYPPLCIHDNKESVKDPMTIN